MWHAFPPLSAARVLVFRILLGCGPWLHLLRKALPPVVRRFHSYYGHICLLQTVHLSLLISPLTLRPRSTAGQSEDLPGPDEVLLNVPWFLDPGMPHFASPMRLVGVAFTKLHKLGASL